MATVTATVTARAESSMRALTTNSPRTLSGAVTKNKSPALLSRVGSVASLSMIV